MNLINIAIVGAGNIAKRVINAINYIPNACSYAIVSRSVEKAKDYQAKYGISCSYSSLGSAMLDGNIHLFYLCTPNQLHYAQIKDCLMMGKNVICEKPFLENPEQIKEVFSLAHNNHAFLMEAQKTVFTPLNEKLFKLVTSGYLGKLRVIHADYATRISESNLSKDHWVFDQKFGGCSFDIGVYPICFANYFANSCIKKIGANSLAMTDKTDYFMSANIIYKNGVIADISSSWFWRPDDEHKGSAFLGGDKGYIIIHDYWKSNKAIVCIDGKREEMIVSQKSDFVGEIAHACKCIDDGIIESPIMGQKESLKIIGVLDAIKSSKIYFR